MIVRFKNVEESQLKTLLHKIPKADYDLISGVKIVITDRDFEKAKVAGFYNYNGINIDFSLLEQNPTEESVNFSEEYFKLADHLAERFIHSKEIVDSLYPGLMLGKNVLFYGRGGHGKSEMTECFFDKALELGLIQNKPFVQALGEGLTEEALFGGLEMKKFMDNGEYEYLVKNSFMNHEIVVFEEIFDAPAPILLSLKDILSSGYFRKGHQTFKIKTKMIIGLTNRSKEEFSEDDSLEALVQRFSITRKVEWEAYTKTEWKNLFNKVFGNDKKFMEKNKVKLADLANILELNNSVGAGFVSPRTAISAAQLYAFGSSLDLISDIDKDVVKKYFKENKDTVLIQEASTLLEKARNYIDSIKVVCESYVIEELEDSILGMLSGDVSEFSDKEPLTPSDIKSIEISINKLSWTRNHLMINHVPVTLEESKKELLTTIDSFENKLKKALTK